MKRVPRGDVDRHAEARAGVFRREERLVNPIAHIVGDPRSIILNADLDTSVITGDLERHVTASRGGLDGIAYEVLDGLVELRRVHAGTQMVGADGLQLDAALLRANTFECDNTTDQLHDIVLSQVQLGRARECEEIVEQRRQSRDLLARDIGGPGELLEVAASAQAAHE